MAIISASRRTDIPAFFADWFMERIREGHFLRVNPFNNRQVKRISLAPQEVDAFVFWSKNPRPLMEKLDELDARGFRYYFQFTLNPYGAPFEAHLPPLAERLLTFRELAGRIGAERVIWRYDPIIISSATPLDFHRQRFAEIACALKGATRRVMFSYLDFYPKARPRLQEIEQQGVTFSDLAGDEFGSERSRLLAAMLLAAGDNGMELYSCCEAENPAQPGTGQGRCIDGRLIEKLFGCNVSFRKDRHQRKECGCAEAIDMGAYNSCAFQCVYCYANASPARIAANLKRHSASSAALIENCFAVQEEAHKKVLKR